MSDEFLGGVATGVFLLSPLMLFFVYNAISRQSFKIAREIFYYSCFGIVLGAWIGFLTFLALFLLYLGIDASGLGGSWISHFEQNISANGDLLMYAFLIVLCLSAMNQIHMSQDYDETKTRDKLGVGPGE